MSPADRARLDASDKPGMTTRTAPWPPAPKTSTRSVGACSRCRRRMSSMWTGRVADPSARAGSPVLLRSDLALESDPRPCGSSHQRFSRPSAGVQAARDQQLLRAVAVLVGLTAGPANERPVSWHHQLPTSGHNWTTAGTSLTPACTELGSNSSKVDGAPDRNRAC
jgi:hypothetical protein